MDSSPSLASHALVGLLTRERERQLLDSYADHGDAAALAELVRAHLPLVRGVVRRYRLRSLREEDLVAEGTLGLIEAAQRFDRTFHARFASYAAHWVRAKVREYVLRFRRIVAPPDTRAWRRILGRRSRVDAELTQAFGRAPSVDELASAMGVKASDYRELRACFESRDVTFGADGESGLGVQDGGASAEELVSAEEERRARREALASAIAALPSRERCIVERRRLAPEPVPRQELAREMSISRERVRQLELRGISMLERALGSSPLAAAS